LFSPLGELRAEVLLHARFPLISHRLQIINQQFGDHLQVGTAAVGDGVFTVNEVGKGACAGAGVAQSLPPQHGLHGVPSGGNVLFTIVLVQICQALFGDGDFAVVDQAGVVITHHVIHV